MLRDDLNRCAKALEDAGIDSPQADAFSLLEHVTGLSRASLLAKLNSELTPAQAAQLDNLTLKRAGRYPLQYILGSWSFLGIELAVGEGVLIPRDDTEVVFSLCREFLDGKQRAKAVDLCSGSGALAIALDKLCGADVTAVELSGEALSFLNKNINSNNSSVKSVKGDVFTCHTDFADGSLDLIVSNPPYIKSEEISALQPEVHFEPRMALDGGESGFDFYESIIKNWSGKLKSGGALAFELGEDQADKVRALMSGRGFKIIRTAEDFGGVQRAIIGTML